MEPAPLATFGLLTDGEHKLLAYTLELPWLDNQRDVSCIPLGTYAATRRWSPKHRCDVFELQGVPGRSNIELHVGNTVSDTEGCILLGSGFGTIPTEAGDVKGIIRSKPAFDRFMSALEHVDEFELAVVAAP